MRSSAGAITVEGRPVHGPGAPSRRERARLAQIVFQDPFATLNPRETVRRALTQPLTITHHGRARVMLISADVTPVNSSIWS